MFIWYFRYCKALDKQYLKPYQAAIFEGACSLLHEANEEESLMLILDSINAAFNVRANVYST